MKRIFIFLAFFLIGKGIMAQHNEAILHFVRPDNFAGKFVDMKIFLNSSELGSLSNKSHLVAKTSVSGNVKITLRAFGSPP